MKLNKVPLGDIEPGTYINWNNETGLYCGKDEDDDPIIVVFDEGFYMEYGLDKYKYTKARKKSWELIGFHGETPIVKRGKKIWAGCTPIDRGLWEDIGSALGYYAFFYKW